MNYSRIALSILFLIIVNACNSSKKQGQLVCDGYYRFIKSNWYKDSSGIFKLRDRENIWNASIEPLSVQENCILGLNKINIDLLFGTPTSVYNEKSYIYCLDDDCLLQHKTFGGYWMIVHFDKTDKVIKIDNNPFVSYEVKPKY